jgi:hypothetical protein
MASQKTRSPLPGRVGRAFYRNRLPHRPCKSGRWSPKRAFLEFSLCLSRACLGKKLHLIYKWLKKPGFSPVRADEFALVEVTRRLRAWQAAR